MGSADDRELIPSARGFDVVRHGFDRNQVRQHISSLESNLRLLNADRDSALSQVSNLSSQLDEARTEIAQLRARVDELCKPAKISDDVHDRLRVMVNVAKAEAAEITARAQSVAEQTWTNTQRAATVLRNRYEALLAELDQQQAELRSAHASSMDRAMAEADQIVADVQQRRELLGEAAEAEYQRIEREFHDEMTRRRADLDQEVAQRHEASVTEAERMVREATEEANRRTEWADQKMRDLAALRDTVSDRLRQTSQLLAESSALLEPHESEVELMDGEPFYDGSGPPASATSA
jgi:colicin import membrane protein